MYTVSSGRNGHFAMAATPLRPIEQIADGLQRCINEAAEKAAEKAVQGLAPRLDRQDAAIQGIRDHVDARLDRQDATIRELLEHVDVRLDRQDETLRMMWKQMKGNGRLPIDD